MFNDLKALLQPVFEQIGFPLDWLDSPDFWALVYTVIGALISGLLFVIYKLGSWWLHRRKQNFLIKNLNPWFSDEEIEKATRFYIPTQFQRTSPSHDDEPDPYLIGSPRAPLIKEFLKKFHRTGAKNKFFLILADAGMGKTTFMINLYLRYQKKWMPFRPKYQMKLFPLGRPGILEELNKIDDEVKKDTILLLDAFDEDTKALGDYKKRMDDILDKAWRFRAMVITCRTHFFPTEKEQPHITSQFSYGGGGEYTLQPFYISVFSNWDVVRYLNMRFNILNLFNWKKLQRAWKLTSKSQKLIVRPMLLSHIRELVNEEREYEYSYQVYEALIDEWIKWEADKSGIREKYGSKEAYKQKIKTFSQELAVDMYNNRGKRGGLFVRYDEPFFAESGFSLTDLEEDWSKTIKESELRSRSLLNRNTKDFKFAHKSILEYFLAKYAFENKSFFRQLNYVGMDIVPLFLKEMVLGEVLSKAEGEFLLADSAYIKKFKEGLSRSAYQFSDPVRISLPTDKLYKSSERKNRLSIPLNSLQRLEYLSIKNASQINIWLLSALFSKSINKKNVRFVITDHDRYPILYFLYLIRIVIDNKLFTKSGLEKKFEENLILVDLHRISDFWHSEVLKELNKLSELRIRMEQWDTWEILDTKELLTILGWPEFLIPNQWILIMNCFKQSYHELLKIIELLDPKPHITRQLQATNDFIRQCQELEKNLPKNVKLIY